MLELEKWGRGRGPLMTMFSHSVVLGAEAVCELCKVGRDGEFRGKLARIEDKRAWLGNYKKQGFFVPDPDFAGDFFTASAGKKAGKRVRDDIEFIRDYQAATDAQKKKFRAAMKQAIKESGMTWQDFGRTIKQRNKSAKEVYKRHVEDIRKDIRSKDAKLTAAQKLVALSTDMRFFLFVSVPCWLEYRVSPRVLFDGARAGDFDSMRKLLSLDPECLEDVRIRREHTRLIQTSNDVRRKMLATAAALQPLSAR